MTSESRTVAGGPTIAIVVDADGNVVKDGWRALALALQVEMPVRKRKGRGGMTFDYITARQVQDRLDDVIGPGRWSTKYNVLYHDPARNTVVVECQLTISGVTKADTGSNNNPDIPEYLPVLDNTGKPIIDQQTGEVKERRNPAWEDEPFKAAYSDAFKRAAVAFGIGRFLYDNKDN